MPLTRRQLLPATAAVLLALPARAGSAPVTDTGFRRGGAIHTMMNWGALRGDDPERYLPRAFETPRNAFPETLVRDFAVSGFDFIRFTLDVGPFMQLRGADREALELKLVENIRLFHDLGLDVIVDCHPVEQVPTYSAPSILDDLEGPVFTEYTAMIGRLAALLAGIGSGSVALELMNEPVVRQANHRLQVKIWGAAQLVLHDAARRAAADLPLVLTGANYGGISGLTDLDPSPFAGSNVLYSFHYYMPISFTHQGLGFGWTDGAYSPYVVDLPYPYDAVPQGEIAAAIEARIAADTALDADGRAAVQAHARRILQDFLSDAWNRDRVEKDMARAAGWADGNDIERHRIIMGECGVTRRDARFTGADPVYRQRWLADVTGLAQANGFGWALWEINSHQMGIGHPEDGSRVDPEILAALGMQR